MISNAVIQKYCGKILQILFLFFILTAPWIMAEEDARNSTWTSIGPEGGTI